MKSSNSKHDFSNRSTTSSKLPKLRWYMILNALQGQLNNSKNSASIRQFSTFGLFDKKEINEQVEEKTNDEDKLNNSANESTLKLNKLDQSDNSIQTVLTNESNDEDKWFYYSLNYKEINFQIKLKFTSNKIPIKELFHGFDNTGNYLWPSEEILSYFCLKNNFLFNKLKLCELGCGMAAFAGLTVAISSQADYVLLTDGNPRCIKNVESIIKQNENLFNQTVVECKQFKWRLMDQNYDSTKSDQINDLNLINSFDVILVSDCLYFEKSHLLLIETIYGLLKDSGTAIIMAPIRQNTFKEFMKLSFNYFHLKIHIIYDDTVWQLNRKFQRELTDIYKTDLHYPLMAILKKRETILRSS